MGRPWHLVWVLLFGLMMAGRAGAGVNPSEVSFTTSDGAVIYGDLYGEGKRAVILAHGAAFDKESWAPLARHLAEQGFRVLAIDFRGYGKSRGGDLPHGLALDVLGAARYLRASGATTVDAVGGSMGGGAVAEAAAEAPAGLLDRIILLSPVPIENPTQMRAGAYLFIASRGESLAPAVRVFYNQAPSPKRLVMLDGQSHAQNIFATGEGPRLTRLIEEFLSQR